MDWTGEKCEYGPEGGGRWRNRNRAAGVRERIWPVRRDRARAACVARQLAIDSDCRLVRSHRRSASNSVHSELAISTYALLVPWSSAVPCEQRRRSVQDLRAANESPVHLGPP